MAHTGQAANRSYINWDGEDISFKYRSFSINQDTNLADTTGGSDAYTNHVVTTKAVTIDFEFVLPLYAQGGSVLYTKLQNGAAGTLIYGPQGTASGMPRHVGFFTVSNSSISYPYADAAILSGTWTMNDADGWSSDPSNGGVF